MASPLIPCHGGRRRRTAARRAGASAEAPARLQCAIVGDCDRSHLGAERLMVGAGRGPAGADCRAAGSAAAGAGAQAAAAAGGRLDRGGHRGGARASCWRAPTAARRGPRPAARPPRRPAARLTSVVGQLTSVPAGDAGPGRRGADGRRTRPRSAAPALTSGGKPEVLYIGAEYCPYCAAERWAVIVALSRFGTFSGLAPIRSAAKDGGGNAEPYPLTPTWTFAKASYTSIVPDVHPGRGVHQHPRQGHRLLHRPADAHRRPAGAARQVRRGLPGRDPVHRLREQVPERRRVLQPRPACPG